MKICPNCKTECDEAKVYCPNCGNLLKNVAPPQPQPQPTPPQPKNKKLLIVSILLAVSFIANIALLIIVLGGGINGLDIF